MDGGFNGQILIDKLTKLNTSQQSIETLSHWCIFHRKKARHVVETWDKQFHCSPPDQRLSFLYLANDILQNSRWKGSEFVDEFWKVLPRALHYVLHNGDGFGKNAANRLINIWEDRKVFGSHGKTLKEELLGMKETNHFGNAKGPKNNSKGSHPNMMGKLVSCYEHVYSDLANEDSLLSKCQAGVAHLKEVEKVMKNSPLLGKMSSPKLEEQQEKLLMLRECVQQLKKIQTSRETLVSHLRQALREQEFRLNLVSDQLEVAEAGLELAADTYEQPISKKNGAVSLEQRPHEVNISGGSPSKISESQAENRERNSPVAVIYNQQGASSDNAPLSVGDEQDISVAKVESHGLTHIDGPDSKRQKLENDIPHTPPHPPEPMPPLPPPVPYSDSVPQETTTQQMHQNQSPVVISQVAHPLQVPPFQIPLQPPMQPSLATQYLPLAAPYNYCPAPLPPQWTPIPGYSPTGVVPYLIPNSHQNGRKPEESWFASQSSFPGNPSSQP